MTNSRLGSAGPLTRFAAVALVFVATIDVNCTQTQVNQSDSVSQELLALVKEYESYVGSGKPIADFAPSDSTLRVDSGFVLVDATAIESGQDLLTELVRHGLKDGTTYGRLVSGWFPLDSILVAAEMSHLKYMRAAQMATGMGVGRSTMKQRPPTLGTEYADIRPPGVRVPTSP